MAQSHAKGKLKKVDLFVHESIKASQFTIEKEISDALGTGKPAIVLTIVGA